MSEGGFIATLIASIVAGVLIIVFLIIGLERHYGRIHCRAFGENTGRAVKFVVQSRVDTGLCLTRTADGKWIPTSNLREFGDAR